VQPVTPQEWKIVTELSARWGFLGASARSLDGSRRSARWRAVLACGSLGRAPVAALADLDATVVILASAPLSSW